jgi:hypothetical protein
VRTDPTDNGGLFIGRRPGTAPVKYRALPERGSAARRRIDRAIAAALLLAMALVSILFWGPIPAGALWIASRIQYWTGSVSLGILIGFITLLFVLLGGLVVLRRLDQAWILVRRAAGHDQRTGIGPRVFATTAALGAAGFTFWLLFIGGLGSTLAPGS